MNDNPPLDALCSRDTVAEILGLLDPLDTLIAYLRAQGLADSQIGAELGISRQAVWERMAAARARLVAAMPELRATLDGRRHQGLGPGGDGLPPYTVTQAARQLEVSRVTVLGWIHEGVLPGAYRDGSRWLVPRQVLADFRPPGGRKRPDLAAWRGTGRRSG